MIQKENKEEEYLGVAENTKRTDKEWMTSPRSEIIPDPMSHLFRFTT